MYSMSKLWVAPIHAKMRHGQGLQIKKGRITSTCFVEETAATAAGARYCFNRSQGETIIGGYKKKAIYKWMETPTGNPDTAYLGLFRLISWKIHL